MRKKLSELNVGEKFYVYLHSNKKTLVEVQAQSDNAFSKNSKLTRVWMPNGTIEHFNSSQYVEIEIKGTK